MRYSRPRRPSYLPPMILVKQRETLDSGVAVVATVAGISYDEAAAAYLSLGLSPMTGTVAGDLRKVLRLHGIDLGHRSYPITEQDLCRLEVDAILSTVVNVTDSQHWMAWDHTHQRILDPGQRSHKRPLVGWFLKVKRQAAWLEPPPCSHEQSCASLGSAVSCSPKQTIKR